MLPESHLRRERPHAGAGRQDDVGIWLLEVRVPDVDSLDLSGRFPRVSLVAGLEDPRVAGGLAVKTAREKTSDLCAAVAERRNATEDISQTPDKVSPGPAAVSKGVIA